MKNSKLSHRLSRKRRIRAKIRGTSERPRMSVYLSLRRLTVQLINDDAGRTVLAASTTEAKAKMSKDGAKKLGELIAKKAKEAKIGTVVFDRSGYRYHGRIKELAEAARAGGLQF